MIQWLAIGLFVALIAAVLFVHWLLIKHVNDSANRQDDRYGD